MKKLLQGMSFVVMMFIGFAAQAATSVSWLSPADSSAYPAGTSVDLTGQAGASGSIGGTGLDLALVIDVSGSMSGAGITAAKNAAIALVNALPENTTSVSVVKFNSAASTVVVLTPLNPSKNVVIAAINSLTAGGGTTIGAGIDKATAELTGVNHTVGRSQQMVVLSDGQSSGNPAASAAAALAAGVDAVHSVGIPGHNVAQMQAIAAAGNGVYTSVSNLSTLEGIFNGTSGNLVGLDHVDVQLADGTWLYDVPTDGLGNFMIPGQVIAAGANVFTAYAYGTDGSSDVGTLTLYGTVTDVPEPASIALFALSVLGFAGLRRKA